MAEDRTICLEPGSPGDIYCRICVYLTPALKNRWLCQG